MEVKKQFMILMQSRPAGLKLVLSLRECATFDYGALRAVGGLHNDPSINLRLVALSKTTLNLYEE
jgi:hypothetical protein